MTFRQLRHSLRPYWPHVPSMEDPITGVHVSTREGLDWMIAHFKSPDGENEMPVNSLDLIGLAKLSEPASNWKSLKGGLPIDGKRVLARYKGVYDCRVVIFWRDGGGTPHFGLPGEPDGKGSQPATHWAYIPE